MRKLSRGQIDVFFILSPVWLFVKAVKVVSILFDTWQPGGGA